METKIEATVLYRGLYWGYIREQRGVSGAGFRV